METHHAHCMPDLPLFVAIVAITRAAQTGRELNMSIHMYPCECRVVACSGGFIKRDGRSREGEVLVSRLTDRPLRPMFENGWSQDTQVRLEWCSLSLSHAQLSFCFKNDRLCLFLWTPLAHLEVPIRSLCQIFKKAKCTNHRQLCDGLCCQLCNQLCGGLLIP